MNLPLIHRWPILAHSTTSRDEPEVRLPLPRHSVRSHDKRALLILTELITGDAQQ